MSNNRIPTVVAFMKRFPTEDACLEHIMRTRYGERLTCPKCERGARYYRVTTRRAYSCEHCGNQIYPTAGTPFENTRTHLRDWFFVMFLFTTTRNGVAAKEVQRQLGVTYKTAWRMCNLIRQYMGYVDGDGNIGGKGRAVETDETFIGGKDKMGHDDKAIVLGMVERGGDVVTRVVKRRTVEHIIPEMITNILPETRVMTDDAPLYRELKHEAFIHGSVNHSAGEYVRGDIHTNNIEAFWRIVKRSIEGTYVSVSKKWLQTYLCEAEFRWNLRKQPHAMFDLLLQAFPRAGEDHGITSPTIRR